MITNSSKNILSNSSIVAPQNICNFTLEKSHLKNMTAEIWVLILLTLSLDYISVRRFLYIRYGVG